MIRTVISGLKLFLKIIGIIIITTSCNPKIPKEKDIVKNPVRLRAAISRNIHRRINYLASEAGLVRDIFCAQAVVEFYRSNQFTPIWTDSSSWIWSSDSLLFLVQNAPDAGIDTQFLHLNKIISLLKKSKTDSVEINDAALYAQAEILMTDAYFNYANRLCFSQHSPDSIRLKSQHRFSDSMLIHLLKKSISERNFIMPLYELEPKHEEYDELKKALRNYRMDFLNIEFTKIPDTPSNSIFFKSLLKIRLIESCDFDSSLQKSDSLKLATAIKSFQKKHGLFADGIPGKRTLKAMNISPTERIIQLNHTLDQWRAEPDTFPGCYIFVNLPAFNLYYYQNDTLRLESKIICGSLKHNTPVLNSKIGYLILYPFWTVPFSIATKEILPHLQHDTSYLRKQNMEVLNTSRAVIDASEINWKKYSKTYFPFILRQREGLDNSLGVVKFNFPSKYGIYLHETNTRNLFKKDFRALSHGCIRVEQAVNLAYQISIPDSIKYPADSIGHWLAVKTKKQIDLSKKLPLYIRYNLCEVKDGVLLFYEDIYDYNTEL